MVELYENPDALVAMDSLNPNYRSKSYKKFFIVENLFPIDYVLLK
jgi:hypothetical protein